MNHVELFAGVGGFRRAMDLISQEGFNKILTDHVRGKKKENCANG